MNKWQELDAITRIEYIQQVERETGIVVNAIEKDWWVTTVLRALFQLDMSAYLVFKGGTSLSKGWKIIERFSEDIDIAIEKTYLGFPDEKLTSKSQIKNLKKECWYKIHEEIVPQLEVILNIMGCVDFKIQFPDTTNSTEEPVVFWINYNSLFSGILYIPNRVKIEVTARSLHEPCEMIKMNSIISETFPKASFSEESFPVRTAVVKRTFLEKIFLLHEKCLQDQQISQERITRHLYDIEKIMNREEGKEALQSPELYTLIVKHRYDLNNISGMNYRLHHPSMINFLPTDQAILAKWKEDYQEMLNSFIYEENPLSFDELFERMNVLLEQIREIKIDDEFFNEDRVRN